MKGFVDFIRKQGVVGLAIGFILGGAVSNLVSALVNDIVNPLIGVVMGSAESLSAASFKIGSVELMWGDFVAILIDFLIIALVVYLGYKLLRLDKFGKPKNKK